MKQSIYCRISALVLVLTAALCVSASATSIYDLNGDNSVDVADVNIAINVMLGKVSNPASDFNHDGVTDIADLNMVINAMLGKVTEVEEPDAETGMYVSVVGFNDDLYWMPFMAIDKQSLGYFTDFVASLDNAPRANVLYFAIDRTLDSLAAAPLPEHLRNVAIVSFAHALDMGSPRMSGWKYQDRYEYGDAIKSRIESEKVHGLPITAYSVGLKSSSIDNPEDFAEQMRNLASSDENVFIADNEVGAQSALLQVADSLIKRGVSQNLEITMTGPDNGTKMRYTFDDLADGTADDSQVYIEAEYSSSGDQLTNISYAGLTSGTGQALSASQSDGLYLTYAFTDIRLESGKIIDLPMMQEWRWNKRYNVWQRNAEFLPEAHANVSLYSSSLICLDIDCSYSMVDFGSLKSFCSGFLGVLANSVDGKTQSDTYVANGVVFKMIPVKGGTFTMGTNDGYEMETPAHEVTLSDFAIGETEVTQALWQAVMGSNPSNFKGNLQLPVENVTWDECQTFISKLNELTGKRFRLPTDAEWEFAAYGGNNSNGTIFAGSDDIDQVGWYGVNSNSQTHPVASKQPNELGLYDMTGNVWEWCQDWYGRYTNNAQVNPTGPTYGTQRVYRGGSYYNDARFCRIYYRGTGIPSSFSVNRGFRLAM